MARIRGLALVLAVLCAPPIAFAATHDLAGTSWRLVAFQSMDDTTQRPDDPAHYTLHFTGDGRLAVRADCNRGQAGWESSGTSTLKIGPVASTRAMCPPGSMSDQLLRDLADVASYTIRDGHLSLALKMDAGIYEFEPDPDAERDQGDASAPSQASSSGTSGAPAAKPSFDCAKAAPKSAEQAICADPELAALDVELARLYALATAPKARSAATVKEAERQWLATRDACAGAVDARTCLRDAYAARIADIRMQSKEARSDDEHGVSRGPFPFHCEGLEGYINALFVNAEPTPFVRLQNGATIWMLDLGPSGSGARYAGADGLLFWNKGRDATFNRGGGASDLACRQDETG